MKPLKYWKNDTFEISSYQYKLEDRVNKKYPTSGSDNSGKCLYTYNELGFRGDSIKKQGFKVMSLGCSVTEGVGVNDNQTWSSQFVNLLTNGVDMNFGTGGRSNDFISRCLLSYYDIIKPDLVLVMYTSPTRREYYTENNGVEPFVVGSKWGWYEQEEDGRRTHEILCELQNDNEDFINWYKNHLIIKYFLESKGCNWLWNGWFDIPKEYKEFNRFDGVFNPVIDFGADGSHPGPKTHEDYAKNLFNYINLKFPTYIDKPIDFKNKLI
jgi:hypothetical protein